jgi:hypothetical protein
MICTWWPPCDRVVDTVVDERERYCHRHAIWTAERDTRMAVLARDGGKCRRCGVEGNSLDWAHIRSRGAPYIRYDLDNAMILCRKCHMWFTTEPKAWARFVADEFGIDHMNMLGRREIAAERKGGHVDLAAVIHAARAALLTPSETVRYEGGSW